MSDGLDADLSVLDAIASRLKQSGDDLDAVGGSLPALPDAGDVTPWVGAVLAQLTDSAGNLVLGLLAAGDGVTHSRETYARTDAAAAHDFQGMG